MGDDQREIRRETVRLEGMDDWIKLSCLNA